MSITGRNSERGMAALMVTTILMLVISLIIVGFSQVARRNQRDTLDRQLSSQALYAAESGVNAATAVIRSRAALQQPVLAKTLCEPDTNYPDVKLSGDDVKVTCLLIEPNVPDMVYDDVSENVSSVIPITPVSGTVTSATITWRPSNGASNTNAGCPNIATPSYTLPVRSSWNCGHGILRLDMTPLPTGPETQQAKTVFLYPHAQATTVDAGNATSVSSSEPPLGGLVAVRCSDTNNDPKCMVKINFTSPVTQYYINARSIYKNSRLVVDGVDATGTSQSFTGQVMVDVTAKAVDVLKRVQVRIPVEEKRTSSIPAYGIETSESLCKRFSTAAGYYYADPVAGCPLP